MVKEYNTYIFDLDGTLLDTLQDLAESTNFALRTLSLPERTLDEIRLMVGNGVRLLIERAVPTETGEETTQKVFDAFRAHYLEHSMDHTLPYPGIQEMLAELRRRGKKMAIVSNKLQPAVTDLYQQFFSSYVDVAIGERPGLRKKPEPDMVEEALKQLDSNLEDTVYVGDSNVDLLTARNSHLPCMSVLWGFRTHQELLAAGADQFIEKPQEILAYSNNK